MPQTRAADAVNDAYGLMWRFYDTWSAHMTEDVPFYVGLAREVAPGPVVELGAGNGRVALEVARAGVDVVAVEPSAEMREDGERRAAVAGVAGHVRWLDGDMRTFVADPAVDLVTIPFRSFQHLLDTEDQLAALTSIRASLRPGGRLALNIFTSDPFVMVANEGERKLRFTTDEADGRHETYSTARYAIAEQRSDVQIEHEVWDGDRLVSRDEATLRLRLIGRYEMEHLLVRSGFEIVSLHGGFDGRAYGPGPDEMVWIARRP